MKVMKSNCGASVKSSQKPKKMNSGGFMKIGGDLQKLDINKREERGMYGGGMKTRKKPKTRMSTGGMAEKKREDAAKEKEEKGGKKYKKGELVEAYKGKHMKKKKKK